MNLIFANDQTSAPFQYATWSRTRPDDWLLRHTGTLFMGTPGKPLGASLIELRLREGEWHEDLIVSGGRQTNRTDKSIFIAVTDHFNATDFKVNLTKITGHERVGTPIIMDVFADQQLVRSITLGYIGGVTTAVVPFFNPPTNPRQQTVLVLNNHENDNTVMALAVDVDGHVFHGVLHDNLPAGHQHIIEADEVYKQVGADPAAGNKLRLIICSSAPLTVVSKVRDQDSGLMCDNAVTAA